VQNPFSILVLGSAVLEKKVLIKLLEPLKQKLMASLEDLALALVSLVFEEAKLALFQTSARR
jgi:hypothetical protein